MQNPSLEFQHASWHICTSLIITNYVKLLAPIFVSPVDVPWLLTCQTCPLTLLDNFLCLLYVMQASLIQRRSSDTHKSGYLPGTWHELKQVSHYRVFSFCHILVTSSFYFLSTLSLWGFLGWGHFFFACATTHLMGLQFLDFALVQNTCYKQL